MENAHTQWEKTVHIEIKEDKRLFSVLVTVTCRGNWDRGKWLESAKLLYPLINM